MYYTPVCGTLGSGLVDRVQMMNGTGDHGVLKHADQKGPSEVQYGLLYSLGNITYPGRSGDRTNSDVAGDKCMINAIATLKQARKMHMPLDASEVSKNVRHYMRHAKLSYNKVIVILFWGRNRYTTLLKPYLLRELAVRFLPAACWK